MNLKKLKFIAVITIFLLSFITHNLYDWFPSSFTAIFFPVNESIWEHQKMIFTTILIWGVIEYLIMRRTHLNKTNLISSTVISAIANIIIFLIIYMPIYAIWGHNLLVTLIIYFITIIMAQYISYKILSIRGNLKLLNIVSIVLIPLIYILFTYFTYYPPNWDLLFYDSYSDKCGIYQCK